MADYESYWLQFSSYKFMMKEVVLRGALTKSAQNTPLGFILDYKLLSDSDDSHLHSEPTIIQNSHLREKPPHWTETPQKNMKI